MRGLWGISLVFILSLAFAQPRVTIPPEAQVRGEWITLGEIAVISGGDPYLKDLNLGRAPLPCSYRELKGSLIEARIGQRAEVICPETVKVWRACQEIPEERIREVVLEHLKDRFPRAERIALEDFKVSGKAILPPGPVEYLVFENSQDLLGRASFSVLLRTGDVEKKVLVSGEVRVWTKVPLASRRIARGEVLSPEAMTMEVMELSRLPRGIVLDPQALLGKRAKTSLPPGSPFRWDQVEVPPVVKKGDKVRIVLTTPNLKVQALGEVLEEGRIGDRVRVRNLGSGKEIVAEVLDGSTLEVRGF